MKKFFMRNIYKSLLNRIYNPFLMTNVKPEEFIPVEGEKYLVIAPHPDDESIGCGGIMSLYPDYFEVLCLTHGGENDIRKQEFTDAMERCGIKNYKMLDFKDKHVISCEKEFDDLNFSTYDIIFIPFLFDQHKDHKAVSVLLSKKLKKGNYKPGLKIAFYEVWSTITMPNYFVDITNVGEDKKEIINKHTSQVSDKDYAGKILGLNSYRGLQKGRHAVEVFSMHEVKDFLKVVSNIVFDFEADENE